MAIKDKIKNVLKKDEAPAQPPSKAPAATPAPAPAAAGKSSASNGKPAPSSIKMPEKPVVDTQSSSTNGIKTPKTPQDEAIAFFSSGADGQPVQVWELWLEDDGGPASDKSVRILVLDSVKQASEG